MNFGLARRAGAGLGLVGAMSGEVDMVISVVLAVAPASSTSEQAAEFLRAEHARWGKLIRDAGIKAE